MENSDVNRHSSIGINDYAEQKSSIMDRIKRFLKVCGPDMMVMLADTDAGRLITASQSGAEWGYRMILPQILLIPILYMAQEMTTRLGIVTGKGHGQLIRDNFGKVWAILSAVTLAISVIGSLLTEFVGIAGVGELFGISKWITVPISIILLIGIAFSGSYHRVEKIGIAVGLLELTFLVAIFVVKPNLSEMGETFFHMPLNNSSYLYLIAANVGAVIMPWMIFYQQGAVVDKKLTTKSIRREQGDTAIGTVLTQGIMIGFVILFASTVGKSSSHTSLNTVGDLAHSLAPYIGTDSAKIIIGSSILGGSLIAAIVVALAGTWGMTEVMKWPNSLNEKLSNKNKGFYGMYALAFIISGGMVLMNFNMISLAITVEVINALLLPITLGFLLLLEHKVLPAKYKVHGFYKHLVTTLCLIVMAFGLYMIGPTIGLW